MIRWILAFLTFFLPVGAAFAATADRAAAELARGCMTYTGLPGRPGADVILLENTLKCDQLRCNGLRTGQVPFSGPLSGNDETCSIQVKGFKAPFFVYEDNRFFDVISETGELWKIDYRMTLRDRFRRARFPAAEGLRMQEGVYLLVGKQETSLRTTAGNVLWRNVHNSPAAWFPPLRVNDQVVILHGNTARLPAAARRTMVEAGMMRVLQATSGKTLFDVPLAGVYAAHRFPPLAVLHGQKVILPSPGGEILAFSLADLLKRKNRILWQMRPSGSGSVLSATGDPAAPRVYVARTGVRGEKNISAISTENGATLWSVSNDAISTPLALYGKLIVFGTQFGRITALDTSTGKTVMNTAPELDLAPDNENRVMAISEPVVDSLGRVYVAFALVPLELAAKLASNRSVEGEKLEDVMEAEVVGVQLPGGKRIYQSALFELHTLQWGKLLLGMETVGLFSQPDKIAYCIPEKDAEP